MWKQLRIWITSYQLCDLRHKVMKQKLMLYDLWLKQIECVPVVCDLWHEKEDDCHYCVSCGIWINANTVWFIWHMIEISYYSCVIFSTSCQYNVIFALRSIYYATIVWSLVHEPNVKTWGMLHDDTYKMLYAYARWGHV